MNHGRMQCHRLSTRAVKELLATAKSVLDEHIIQPFDQEQDGFVRAKKLQNERDHEAECMLSMRATWQVRTLLYLTTRAMFQPLC